MNTRVIKALIKKDLALFVSNRFYMLITIIGLVCYIGIYFVVPVPLDKKLSLAMYVPIVPPAFSQLTGHEGADVEFFSTEESLKQAVLDSDYQAAISLPHDIMDIWVSGGKPKITVYYASTAPPEINAAIVALVKELSYAQMGQALNFETTEEILGPDMLGNQIALRDRMRPPLAVLILLVEIPDIGQSYCRGNRAGDIGRRWDPQLAAVYYREMVYRGKNHKQAMGAVMSHLGTRILAVLKEDRPYEVRDPEGKLISKDETRKLILSKYHVSEDIRSERRRRNSKISRVRETATYRTNEAAKAPQPVLVQAVSRK